jgi:Mg2+ and Co2+ transporter CorA
MSKAPEASARGAARTPTRTRLYRDGVLVLEGFPAEDISENLAIPRSVIWLDLCAPTAADFKMVNAEFGLHELAIEDALHEQQRPKLDRYPPITCSSALTRSISTP